MLVAEGAMMSDVEGNCYKDESRFLRRWVSKLENNYKMDCLRVNASRQAASSQAFQKLTKRLSQVNCN